MYHRLLRVLFFAVAAVPGTVAQEAIPSLVAAPIDADLPTTPIIRPSIATFSPVTIRPQPTIITLEPTIIRPSSSSIKSTPKTSTIPTSTIKTTSTTSTELTSTSTSTTRPTQPPTTTTDDDIFSTTRTDDMFATIRGIYNLPGQDEVIRNATLEVKNIQCDILVGMRKKLELFLFFEIVDPKVFKKYFRAYVLPKITSVFQILDVSTQPVVALNVAFAQRGLWKLGINDNVLDSAYTTGQKADAGTLGDPGTTNWRPEFTSGKIDGVFLIASDDQSFINTFKNWLLTVLTPAGIRPIYELPGHIRPAPFEGHEMFGYLDGVGQPAVAGFDINPLPGQQIINAGVILDGEFGDTLAGARPPWMFDGSFMAFRQLKQLVPEFDKFLLDNAPPFPGYTPQQNADLLGARIMGRWKSGTPVDLSPTFDNGIGGDPFLNNNFDYSHAGFNIMTDQSHCPFGAHTRKTRPRADQNTPLNAIMRAGIPYGPEVTTNEFAANKSISDPEYERGLAFVGYQSQLSNGFRFIQAAWANDVNFAPGKSPIPGFDVVFGQNNGGARWISGTDINNPPWILNFPTEFVISRGGEYFFSPSISALANPICA